MLLEFCGLLRAESIQVLLLLVHRHQLYATLVFFLSSFSKVDADRLESFEVFFFFSGWLICLYSALYLVMAVLHATQEVTAALKVHLLVASLYSDSEERLLRVAQPLPLERVLFTSCFSLENCYFIGIL